MTKIVNGKPLRRGFTTGSCATAAAKAAAIMLLTGEEIDKIAILTPGGVSHECDVLDVTRTGRAVSCAVKKDGGDDPDVTTGALIYAEVQFAPNGITIDGGVGVGRVTQRGLDQPIGGAAINSTPRRTIGEALAEAARERAYSGGFDVIIYVPSGAELAKKTFNSQMGVIGGISIIGTTGIVDPMSHAAMLDTIKIRLNQLRQNGSTNLLLTLGNYGGAFAAEKLKLELRENVMCSTLIGETLDNAAALGFEKILIVGHIGKLVKLGVGIMNTHFTFGDARIETLIACALKAGADLETLRLISEAVSTDGALEYIRSAGILRGTMNELGARIEKYLKKRVPDGAEVGFVCFTNAVTDGGALFQSGNADDLMCLWRGE